MKRISKIVLLVAILANTLIPAWAQSSTQGKEFWVSLIPSRSPDSQNPSDGKFGAYIAVSATKACQVTISNPNTGWSKSASVGDNSWTEFKTEMTSGDGGFIPIAEWYKKDGMPDFETPLQMGLKVEATEEVSVFCSLRWLNSMDATNILPVTALQQEYIIQTYQPSDKSFKKNVFTILAVDECTVDIELACATSKGRSGTIQQHLKAGEVFHVVSAEYESLNGTRVKAPEGKKIAVFAGSPLANVPTNKSDRDLLYEQLFPVDYWGNNFVVTRSKQKDANRVIITSQKDGTAITIHGRYQSTTNKTDLTVKTDTTIILDSGKSYEFEMSVGNANNRWGSEREAFTGLTVLDSAVYISSADCPFAVLSYDVGNSYLRQDTISSSGEKHLTEAIHTDKIENGKLKFDDIWGAPAMTWIAPVEQMMNEVVFGVMGTDKTTYHYVNIIVPVRGVTDATLNGRPLVHYFHPVESNDKYYYARVSLPNTVDGQPNPYYHLKCRYGFIATVYGNGDDESYAYTVGSSTIKRGIEVDGVKLVNEEVSEEPFCINQELVFNPKVSSDVIDSVKWDFEDGITYMTTELNEVVRHTYTSPGWFNVHTTVWAHKTCPDESYPAEEVNFRIQIVRPDTVIMSAEKVCITLNEYKQDPVKCQKLLDEGNDSIVQEHCYDPVQIYRIVYGLETETYRIDPNDVPSNAELIPSNDPNKPDTVRFSLTDEDPEAWFYGKEYVSSREIVDTVVQRELPHCNHYRHAYVDVKTCLGFKVVQDETRDTLQVCPGDSTMRAFCVKVRGNIEKDADGKSKAHFIVNDGWIDINDIQIIEDPNKDSIEIIFPTDSIQKPGVYNARLMLSSEYKSEGCDSTIYDFVFTVNFSEDIFQYKFNNVLAIYSSAFNGGYTFTNYEWHRIRKDSVTGEEVNEIVGGNSPVYRDTEPFHMNDIYYVRLTTSDSLILDSCPKTIDNVPGVETPQPAEEAPAQKVIYHDRLVIRKGELMYDIYGQRIQ